jgi:GH24 family phage-related lysozyme (muramidase)
MDKPRLPVKSLAVSAAFLIALALHEGYKPTVVATAVDPVPTGGFGSTKDEHGQPLRLGEAIPPERALRVLDAHVGRDEVMFHASLPGVALLQREYEAYMGFIYQYGIGVWNKSSMRAFLLQGDYRAACDALLKYRYSNGQDCSAPGNKTCRGVWTRQLERHKKCIGEAA